MKKILKTSANLTLILVVCILGYKLWQAELLKSVSAPVEINLEDLSAKTGEINEDDINNFPETLNIKMPFYTQAPFSNWDYPWQESCEEASVLLVANLYNNLNLDRSGFNNELLRLIDWEKSYFGSYEHTTVAQTTEMLKINYNLDSNIIENPSFEDIESILNKGHLIVAPFAGKLLFNPNFKNGGPNYHMLVIKGYDITKMQIVTHDVGTRNGENYVYDWNVIENALHDWHDTDMTLGEQLIIEIIPQTKTEQSAL